MAEAANAAARVWGVGMGMMDREGRYLNFSLIGEKRSLLQIAGVPNFEETLWVSGPGKAD